MSAPDAKRAGLQADIDRALLAGTSTAEARARLAAHDRQVTASEHSAVRAAEAEAAAHEAKIEDAIAVAVAEQERRDAAIAEDLTMPPVPNMEDILSVDPDVISAIRALVHVEATLEAASAALVQAEAEANAAIELDRALTAARAEIQARREAGDRRDTDGPDLEVNRLDRESLAPILVARQAALVEASRTVDAARAERMKCIVARTRAENAARSAARVAWLDQWGEIGIEALAQQTADERIMGVQPMWCFPHDLMREGQRRASQRPDLSMSPGLRIAKGLPQPGNGHLRHRSV